jgi:hypothetical protein
MKEFNKLLANTLFGTPVDKEKYCAFNCEEPNLVFDDPLSRKEYGISGICQTCQNKVFAEPDSISCSHCGDMEIEVAGKVHGKPVCDECLDGLNEMYAEMDGPDPHGDRDPSPEQQAGEAFQDKLDMYRNEY